MFCIFKNGLIAGAVWYVLCVVLDFVLLVGVSGGEVGTWAPGLLNYLNNLFMAGGIGFILDRKRG